jgi:hypothetical protein
MLVHNHGAVAPCVVAVLCFGFVLLSSFKRGRANTKTTLIMHATAGICQI